MLKRIAKPLAITLIICLGLPGCSMFDKNRRRELAYERYVRKNMRARQRQIMRSQRAALRRVKKYMVPTEPKITATVEPVTEPAENASGVTESPSTTGENDSAPTQP
jgi:hypothetical protein